MTDILTWLESGCDIRKGIILLEKYSANRMLIRLVKSNPKANKDRARAELCRIAGIKEQPKQKKRSTDLSFRVEFPFLSQSDCPLELKVLVTDKFSSFYTYKDLHAKLFDCTDAKECANVASRILANFKENRMIFAELEYYKKHKTVLGKHPIFNHMNSLKSLRKLSIKDLVLKEQKLEHNIWRINSNLKKNDQPHLKDERLRRLAEKESELAEVKRLLK